MIILKPFFCSLSLSPSFIYLFIQLTCAATFNSLQTVNTMSSSIARFYSLLIHFCWDVCIQDANECWGLLTRTVDVILSSPAYPRGGPVAQYFGIDQRETLSCVEAPEVSVHKDNLL